MKLLLSDTTDVPALLDVMLCEDVLAEFARPLAGVLEDVALTDLAAAHDRLATQLDALPSEAAGAVRSALLVQGELLRLIHALVENKSIRTPSADELAMDHGGVRRWFLTEAPLEVAQRFVAWERGALATVGVAAALEPTASLYDYSPLTLRLLAETARDGAKAMLAILASARPELVPIELVAAEDRFDITAAEQREAEHLETLARIAAQVGDDEIRWLNPRD